MVVKGENSVDISVSVPKGGISGINVFVPGSTGEVTARDNLAQTYAEWARLWAIKEGDKVNGEDYSSKYYAQQARYSANNAKISEESCIAKALTLQTNYELYLKNLTELSETSLNDIEEARIKAVEEITDVGGGVDVNEFNELQQNVTTIKQDIENINIELTDIRTDLRNKKEIVFAIDKENKTLIISYKEEL